MRLSRAILIPIRPLVWIGKFALVAALRNADGELLPPAPSIAALNEVIELQAIYDKENCT